MDIGSIQKKKTALWRKIIAQLSMQIFPAGESNIVKRARNSKELQNQPPSFHPSLHSFFTKVFQMEIGILEKLLTFNRVSLIAVGAKVSLSKIVVTKWHIVQFEKGDKENKKRSKSRKRKVYTAVYITRVQWWYQKEWEKVNLEVYNSAPKGFKRGNRLLWGWKFTER